MSAEPLRFTPSTDRPATLDLGTRWRDVIRIARRHRSFRALLTLGWDVDDLGQELVCRVLAKQRTRSAYDPTRSGVARYLHLVTGSLLDDLLASATAASRGGHAGRVGVEVEYQPDAHHPPNQESDVNTELPTMIDLAVYMDQERRRAQRLEVQNEKLVSALEGLVGDASPETLAVRLGLPMGQARAAVRLVRGGRG